MGYVIAGRFEQQGLVQQAREEILRAGFSEDKVSTFYLNPPGQHDLYKVGGDRDESPGAKHSESGLIKGGAAGAAVGVAVGAVTIPVLGPVGPIAGGLLGAHLGDLGGALGSMDDNGEAAARGKVPLRRAGLMVAVAAENSEEEKRAISVLQALHAEDIERSEGQIVDGDWQDFDPLAPPSLLDAGRDAGQRQI